MQSTITDLLPIYQETLYTEPLNTQQFQKFGNGSNGFAALIQGSDNTPETIALLQKMVGACKLNFDDCAIIEVPTGANALDCFKLIDFTTILSFGIFIDNGIIQLPTVAYTIFKIGISNIICSHSLMELKGNDSYKNALWQCLKGHFKL
jgi:hypothetical protein